MVKKDEWSDKVEVAEMIVPVESYSRIELRPLWFPLIVVSGADACYKPIHGNVQVLYDLM
jgi:hypothetical protein